MTEKHTTIIKVEVCNYYIEDYEKEVELRGINGDYEKKIRKTTINNLVQDWFIDRADSYKTSRHRVNIVKENKRLRAELEELKKGQI